MNSACLSEKTNVDVSVGSHEKRGLLHCTLRLPDRTDVVHAICVHLGLRQSHRARQLQQLCHFVKRVVPQKEPLLVAGDFNDWRGQAHAVLLEGAGRADEAVACYRDAAARTSSTPERNYLLTKAAKLARATGG